jgi:hypothetical protein
MVHRDVGGPLLELAHRVAARAHRIGDQSVCVTNGSGRVVDEPRLCVAPRPGVPPCKRSSAVARVPPVSLDASRGRSADCGRWHDDSVTYLRVHGLSAAAHGDRSGWIR